jgi:hypothetical protein
MKHNINKFSIDDNINLMKNGYSFDLIHSEILKQYKTFEMFDYQYFDFVVYNYLDDIINNCKELHIIYSSEETTKNVFIIPKKLKCGIDSRIKNTSKEFEAFKKIKDFIKVYGCFNMDLKLFKNNERIKIISYIIKNFSEEDKNILNCEYVIYPHFTVLFVNHEIVKYKFIVEFQKISHCIVFNNCKFSFDYENKISFPVQRYFKFQQDLNFCYGNKYDLPVINNIISHLKNIEVKNDDDKARGQKDDDKGVKRSEFKIKYILFEHNNKPIIGIFRKTINEKFEKEIKSKIKTEPIILNLYDSKTYESYYLGKCIGENIKYDINNMLV